MIGSHPDATQSKKWIPLSNKILCKEKNTKIVKLKISIKDKSNSIIRINTTAFVFFKTINIGIIMPKEISQALIKSLDEASDRLFSR